MKRKKNLKNIKKSLSEIVISLANNPDIQRYLLVDSYNVKNQQNFTPLTINEILEKGYISLSPRNEDAIQQMDRNTLIILVLEDINFNGADGNYIVTCAAHVITDFDHILCDNGSDRALEISDLICQTLDGMKLSAAGEININFITRKTYSEFTTGYKISFDFSEQTTVLKEVEI